MKSSGRGTGAVWVRDGPCVGRCVTGDLTSSSQHQLLWNGLGSPVSHSQDQELYYWEALWAADKKRKQPMPNLCPLLLTRRNLGDFSLTEFPRAPLPSDLVSTLWESLMLLALTWWKVRKLLFGQKGEKEEPCLRHLCHPLTDQVGQELTWLSCPGMEVVLSDYLWDILTEEGLTVSSTSHYNSRGTSVISESMPSGRLLFWSLKESINLVVVPNFLNWKSYLGQILCHITPTALSAVV